MFKRFRILILLLVLLFVALSTYLERVRSTDWNLPLRVAVFPINADGSTVANQHIAALADGDFAALESFFVEEARRYGVTVEPPIRFSRGARIRELPPTIDQNASTLSVIFWSLRTRYWAWRAPDSIKGPAPDVRMFVLYHDPDKSPTLPHSLGLQKGLFAIVNAFADRELAGSNDTVIAHELLHTLGATDKYDPMTSQPVHPEGFAEPQRQPLYPQSFAELMGGRIPVSPTQARIPRSLRQVTIGPITAVEIGWIKP